MYNTGETWASDWDQSWRSSPKKGPQAPSPEVLPLPEHHTHTTYIIDIIDNTNRSVSKKYNVASYFYSSKAKPNENSQTRVQVSICPGMTEMLLWRNHSSYQACSESMEHTLSEDSSLRVWKKMCQNASLSQGCWMIWGPVWLYFKLFMFCFNILF